MSYPFHPAIRDLYARFRENQGFQQTRGLIRLMRIVVSRIWATDHDPYLIAAHDLDLVGSQETLSEINQINNTLGNAIAHDIASGGQARSPKSARRQPERPRGRRAGRHAAVADRLPRQRAERSQGPRRARRSSPTLCAPERDVSPNLQNDVIARLATAAWYLHTTS